MLANLTAPNIPVEVVMIRLGIVGLGKMGLSHLAIARPHPQVQVVGVCDSSRILVNTLSKFTGIPGYSSLASLIQDTHPDAVIIATPTALHSTLVKQSLLAGLDVFCEKPFVLDVGDGEKLIELAEENELVTQVGYHYRFVGAFREAERLVRSGALGQIHHVRAEAYGPVVLRPTNKTWRTKKNNGGGALYDYACHAIDLVSYVVGNPDSVSGVAKGTVFSSATDDEVYCTLQISDSVSGQLCVCWSDPSQRKMSTKISVWGTNGHLVADRQEIQIYASSVPDGVSGISAGWTVKNTTELTPQVAFYLRGEEYSQQLDYFVESVLLRRRDGENSFSSALSTDRIVDQIARYDECGETGHVTESAITETDVGLFRRLFARR